MVNYFDSIKLYSWKMSDEQVSKFEKNLDKLEWKYMLFIQLFLAAVLSISSYILLRNISPTGTNFSTFWLTFISNLVLGVLFLFGGYYFTKLFFKTQLSVTEFYTVLIYLYLPILTMYVILSLLSMILSYISPLLISGVLVLYLPILYYVFKELNTSIYLFKKEFNTTDWPLVGVVLLWGFITAFITNVLNSVITSIFL